MYEWKTICYLTNNKSNPPKLLLNPIEHTELKKISRIINSIKVEFSYEIYNYKVIYYELRYIIIKLYIMGYVMYRLWLMAVVIMIVW